MTTAEKPTGKWHAMEVSQVVERLDTDLTHGLSEEEAARRIELYGPNKVTTGKRKSRLQAFLEQFTNPLVIILLAASLITFLLGEYLDSGVIMAVVIINAIIGFVQESKAESAIEALARMLKVEATVLRDGDSHRIPADQIVPGDVVILQSGDKVPADLRLVEIKNLQVDESILTGESVPVSLQTSVVEEDEPVAERVNMAYSGTLVSSGTGKGVATGTGDDTEIGRIHELVETAPTIATPLTGKLAKFGKLLSFAVLGVSALTFGLGVFVGRDAIEMFFTSVAIAVAMIPEGLPAIVTIVLAIGVNRMASRHAIIRTLPSVETLGSVTVICSDKTGTLTKNEMTVREVFTGGLNFEIGGVGYDPRLCCVVPTDTDDTELETKAFRDCLRAGLLCNDSGLEYKDEQWIPTGDPTEVALIVSAMKAGFDPEDEKENYPRLDVVPFESEKMYMATLHSTSEGGRIMFVKGSIEKMLDMSSSEMCDGTEREVSRERVMHRYEDLAGQGYRMLAFAEKEMPEGTDAISDDDLRNLTFLGLQAMSDPARPEAIEAVRECKEAGIQVKMITGDHVITAKAIARDLGIGGLEVVAKTGSELAQLSDEEFARTAQDALVFARVSPEQKYRLVEALQKAGNVVAMTGDGVNDAPALKKADIGVAMGMTGSDVARDASNMVLTDDNFASIVAAVEEGRTVFSNLIKSLVYILPTNAGEGMVIIAALLGGLILPVTPVQLLWINTVTAVALALPLAYEPAEPGLMKLKPRDPEAPMIPRHLIERIVLVGIVMVIGTFVIFLYEESIGASPEQARTAAVGTIVAYEIFYLFSARSERIPIWQMKLFNNPYIWVGILLVILLQSGFTYLPIMNVFFGTAPLPFGAWLRIIAVAFPILIVVGIEKTIRMRLGHVGRSG